MATLYTQQTNKFKKIGILFLVGIFVVGCFLVYKKEIKIFRKKIQIPHEDLVEYMGDSRISFKYNKDAEIQKLENPVSGDLMIWLRIIDKKNINNMVEIEYSEGGDLIEARKNNFTGLDVKEEKFGENIFGVYVDYDQHKKVFQYYKGGYVIAMAIPDTENILGLIDLSSVAIHSGIQPTSPEEALKLFSQYLYNKDYPHAGPLFYGLFGQLLDWNPLIPKESFIALWKNGCEVNGLHCLPIKEIINKQKLTPKDFFGKDVLLEWKNRQDVYSEIYKFTVTYQNPDGTTFTTGPCCGLDTSAQIKQFTAIVGKSKSDKFYVLSYPPYVE